MERGQTALPLPFDGDRLVGGTNEGGRPEKRYSLISRSLLDLTRLRAVGGTLDDIRESATYSAGPHHWPLDQVRRVQVLNVVHSS